MYHALSAQSAYTFIQNLFNENNNNSILDPLSCVIRLAILSFKPNGTKISITQNKISYNEPSILQGTIRWTQGDNRDDLHNIFKPLLKATEWYDTNKSELQEIFKLAISGLEKLKQAYSNNSTINHSIDRYILILQNDTNDTNSSCSSSSSSSRHNSRPSSNSRPITRNSASSSAESNHIFEELKLLWSPREINIINNLLLEINDLYDKDEPIEHMISSVESIINQKEQSVNDLLVKASTILE